MGALYVDEAVRVPAWVRDLASFRRWAKSDHFPERGKVAFLAGELWVDLTMERVAHNLIKTRIGAVLTLLAEQDALGSYFGDGMRLSNVAAGLSTEPDGMFVSHASLEAGTAELTEGDDSLELTGTPDMVLEVVSPTSVEKDERLLRSLYAAAGIPEYWLVDARAENPELELLRLRGARYAVARKRDGWVKSAVFRREFKLTRRPTRQGISEFRLQVS